MMPERFAVQQMMGWGRFPREECRLYRPERRAGVAAILRSGEQRSYLARGLGRSYGDACLNRGQGLISMLRLNRFLGFDPGSGVLHCEAGVSLDEIVQVFVPRGYFLPVTPGTRYVTVGGAIANDVHGKNHHKHGAFGNFVREFELLTPGGAVLTCSLQQNADLFRASVGGLGLTGVILTARIALRPIETAYVSMDLERTRDLDDTLDRLQSGDQRYDYSVAWVDCLAGGTAVGRSAIMRANHAPASALPPGTPPLALRRHGRQPRIPIDFPNFTLNPLSVRLFNDAYYWSRHAGTGQIEHLEPFFYPLDVLRDWNRMYGGRGFIQYQAAWPEAHGPAGVAAALGKIRAERWPAFLAVLKRFGESGPGLLSFPLRGYTLALDLPLQPNLLSGLAELDRVVLEHGGRLYPAKDARTSKEHYAAMYPGLSTFRRIKATVDPDGLLSSSLSRRLGIDAP